MWNNLKLVVFYTAPGVAAGLTRPLCVILDLMDKQIQYPLRALYNFPCPGHSNHSKYIPFYHLLPHDCRHNIAVSLDHHIMVIHKIFYCARQFLTVFYCVYTSACVVHYIAMFKPNYFQYQKKITSSLSASSVLTAFINLK